MKKYNYSPSLVCTNTQIPIIGWENRYITKTEGARLQCMEGTCQYYTVSFSANFQ
ncbi:MAG: hypothetical protein U5L45_00225 [Saprospiraceae bacterium]|nr:hypothetical protein [Saprospiraceae bacterium]